MFYVLRNKTHNKIKYFIESKNSFSKILFFHMSFQIFVFLYGILPCMLYNKYYDIGYLRCEVKMQDNFFIYIILTLLVLKLFS